jgi:hypothetical protein
LIESLLELVGISENNQIQSTEPGGYSRQKGKNMSNIKVGDRVVVTHENHEHCMKIGTTGTVKYIASSIGKVAVEFDKPFVHGYSCNGTTAPYRGQWMFVCDLKVLSDKKKVENKSEFHTGDRVIYARENKLVGVNIPVGSVGTVKGNHPIVCDILAIELDSPVTDGHSCGGMTDPHRGQWVSSESLDLFSKVSNWKIVIAPDRDKTTATLYNGKKAERSATVQRYHKDKYDVFTAADEAVKKLFGKQEKPEPEKPKRFTGRAVRKAPITGFTVGKIYSFKDGFCVDDKGAKRPEIVFHRGDPDETIERWIERGFIKINE